MRKKGFTLIELLAVILILGIIALIAVPQVTNVINNASKGAAETSAEHYVGAVNTTIGLNKLDTDSSNDIHDGAVDVSSISVDMTGETPTAGYVVLLSGVVKQVEVELNDKTVLCDEKGKCTAIDRYVYWASAGTPSNVSDCLEERPTDSNAYLKYSVINNKLSNPQACLYDGEEECNFNTSYDVVLVKVYKWLELTPTNQKPTEGNSINLVNPSDNRLRCTLSVDRVECYSGDRNFVIDYTNNRVQVADLNNLFSCTLGEKGSCSGLRFVPLG